MGKAIIISGGDKGNYQIDLIYDMTHLSALLAAVIKQQSALNDLIVKENLKEHPSVSILAELAIRQASLQKRRALIEALPEKKRVQAWAADYAEDLSGIVGTIEVPDTPMEDLVIHPSGPDKDLAVYTPERDGKRSHALGMGPAALFFLQGIMPGVQKWRPGYRFGQITSLSGDKCDVMLLAAPDVNGQSLLQTNTLKDVVIEYMNCNEAAFSEGDEVIISFGRAWSSPRVIGFKSKPKPCEGNFAVIRAGYGFCVWDLDNDDFAKLYRNGELIEYPCPEYYLLSFYDTTEIDTPSDTYWEEPAPQFFAQFARIDTSNPYFFDMDESYSDSTSLSSCADGNSDSIIQTYTFTRELGDWIPPSNWHMEMTSQSSKSTTLIWQAGGAHVGEQGVAYGACMKGAKAGFEDAFFGLSSTQSGDSFTDYVGITPFSVQSGTVQNAVTSGVQFKSPLGNGPSQSKSGTLIKTKKLFQGWLQSGDYAPSVKGVQTRGKLIYSDFAVFQIYHCVYHWLTGGPDKPYVIGPEVVTTFVSMEFEPEGLLSTGYAPKGAPIHAKLTKFVNDAVVPNQGLIVECTYRSIR